MKNFKTLTALIARNAKIYFRDKGVFFPSLLAPLILLFLFIAFLGNVYRDSIQNVVAEVGFAISGGAVESIASGWLISSLLAVCAVTIAFTANIVMVQDKVTGRIDDLTVSPVSRHILALSYFISTFAVTALICLVALGAGFIYIGIAGWHLTAADVFSSIADTLLLTLFGTALSSLVCRFVRSAGGVTAVQATVSSAYGFICGAYIPFGNLTPWLRKILMLLPGSYGTGLLHEHLMGGAIDALLKEGAPAAAVEGLRRGFDCTLDFFGSDVPLYVCYLVLVGATLLIIAIYVALCAMKPSSKRK